MNNNKDIPEGQINERVARAQGWVENNDYIVIMDGKSIAHIRVFTEEPRKHRPDLRSSAVFDPLTNHNQFHEIMTPDMEAKVCDVLDEWLSTYDVAKHGAGKDIEWWHIPKYKANPRLWKLRAVCEVLSNADTQ